MPKTTVSQHLLFLLFILFFLLLLLLLFCCCSYFSGHSYTRSIRLVMRFTRNCKGGRFRSIMPFFMRIPFDVLIHFSGPAHGICTKHTNKLLLKGTPSSPPLEWNCKASVVSTRSIAEQLIDSVVCSRTIIRHNWWLVARGFRIRHLDGIELRRSNSGEGKNCVCFFCPIRLVVPT